MSQTSGAPASEAVTVMATVPWTVAATPTNSISIAWRSHAGTRSTPANTSSSCSSTSPSAPAPKSQSPSGHLQTTRQTAAPAI
ncbi:hypothetical protein ACN38_g12302 [Penicillium nordicum]|uniref:Uncharacterized protein n=1 Tax=Penicillium nordicum TaxID=229535 RepID=A0A0M9WA64_9EURO|nr:hypothetical protein ACN38_g12302 [Penicillium nordicum]